MSKNKKEKILSNKLDYFDSCEFPKEFETPGKCWDFIENLAFKQIYNNGMQHKEITNFMIPGRFLPQMTVVWEGVGIDDHLRRWWINKVIELQLSYCFTTVEKFLLSCPEKRQDAVKLADAAVNNMRKELKEFEKTLENKETD